MENSRKIMIVSAYAPPSKAGSGLMMWHLLSRFPKDELIILTSESDQGDERYRLKAPYYYYGTPLTSFHFNGTNDTRQQKLRRMAKTFPPTRFLGQWFYAIRLIQRIVKIGSEAIAKEKPVKLVAYSDIGPALIGTYILSRKHNIPFSLFFYDLYLGNKLPFAFNLLSRYYEPLIFQAAQHIFVMCDALKELYEKRYGREDINVIYNSTAAPTNNVPLNEPKVPTITYIGSLYWAQLGALKDLIAALPLVPEKPKLKLYTPHSREYLNETGIYEDEYISFHTCPPEEVSSVLNSSTLNFVGLSINNPYPKLINTSSPGRLCEYLRSDIPMLIHAPKDSFLTSYAIANDFAFVSTDQDAMKLAQVISVALKGDDQKVKNAHMVSGTNHDPEANAKKYYDILTNAI